MYSNDYDKLNESRLYVARVMDVDSGNTRCIKFMCPILSNATLRAIPLSDPSRQIQIGDEVLIIQPQARFSDTLFYIPIRIDPEIVLKNELKNGINYPSKSCSVSVTNPGNVVISATDGIKLTVSTNTKDKNNTIEITNSGRVVINGNLEVTGDVITKSNYVTKDEVLGMMKAYFS